MNPDVDKTLKKFEIKLVLIDTTLQTENIQQTLYIVGLPSHQNIFLLACLSTFWHPC